MITNISTFEVVTIHSYHELFKIAISISLSASISFFSHILLQICVSITTGRIVCCRLCVCVCVRTLVLGNGIF